MTLLDAALTDWSRAQFALTAIYHWFFVPLTLGLSFIMAITETIYVKTGNEEWKKITKFWMTLFGINFAIGVATGIILEFEFGTNWSKYSWIVGDIFGAPLAVEGIFAFFLESTFIAVMFFGWEKLSKKFHLLSTWLVAFGSNLSAFWILVANAWMNYPTGMEFNPDTARSEMISFVDVALSPFAVNKFLHTISSAYIISALFVVGVSSWYLLKNRNELFAKKSILVASVFGVISSFFIILTGDGSAYQVAQKQPMKLAVMEGLYEGKEGAGLLAFGILNHSKQINDSTDPYIMKVEIPKLLSLLGYRDANAFVPGIKDLVYGNEKYGIEPAEKRIERGKKSVDALKRYKEAKANGDTATMNLALAEFKETFHDFGYAYFDRVEQLVPNIPLVFYSFHIMVALGFLFLLIFILTLWYSIKDTLQTKKWLLRIALWSIPLGYLASQLGWVVAEVGRQPWAIQNILPVFKATSHLSVGAVQTTFFLFLILFTILLTAEIRILVKQIKNGPKE
ncbi:MAG: cytochrome ubiquinol oxidase subunit I [Bacteroidales bacterium]|nr:cytochrome ubiquinol oxidase subunit I [Bacteroidales bacterium]